MILDTSAIMAVLLGEDDTEHLADTMFENPRRRISAGTWIELSAVVTRRQDRTLPEKLEALMRLLRVEIVAVSVSQAEIGHAAYRLYGRGTKHRARLNFGDCFTYALAKDSGEPLLYKGDDFVHTDIASAR